MSNAVQTHHVIQFGRNVEMLLQQRGGKLPGTVSRGSYTGKSGVVVEQVGQVKAIKNRSRHSDTPLIETPSDRRWVYPSSYTHADLIDNLDVTKMLIDPKSMYVMAQAEALGRASDDEIGAAFFGASATGENGTVSVTFPAANIVGVNVGGANSGLNVPKLRAARRLLMAAGVDLAREKAYMSITSVEHDNLLGELQVTNLDYNEKPTLVDGVVTYFMGINFVHVEWQAQNNGEAVYDGSLPTIIPGGLASTVRNLPVYVPSGMHYGTWGDVQSRVDPRPDKNYNTQVWSEMICGATRTQEGKVVQIVCNG